MKIVIFIANMCHFIIIFINFSDQIYEEEI